MCDEWRDCSWYFSVTASAWGATAASMATGPPQLGVTSPKVPCASGPSA